MSLEITRINENWVQFNDFIGAIMLNKLYRIIGVLNRQKVIIDLSSITTENCLITGQTQFISNIWEEEW